MRRRLYSTTLCYDGCSNSKSNISADLDSDFQADGGADASSITKPNIAPNARAFGSTNIVANAYPNISPECSADARTNIDADTEPNSAVHGRHFSRPPDAHMSSVSARPTPRAFWVRCRLRLGGYSTAALDDATQNTLLEALKEALAGLAAARRRSLLSDTRVPPRRRLRSLSGNTLITGVRLLSAADFTAGLELALEVHCASYDAAKRIETEFAVLELAGEAEAAAPGGATVSGDAAAARSCGSLAARARNGTSGTAAGSMAHALTAALSRRGARAPSSLSAASIALSSMAGGDADVRAALVQMEVSVEASVANASSAQLSPPGVRNALATLTGVAAAAITVHVVPHLAVDVKASDVVKRAKKSTFLSSLSAATLGPAPQHRLRLLCIANSGGNVEEAMGRGGGDGTGRGTGSAGAGGDSGALPTHLVMIGSAVVVAALVVALLLVRSRQKRALRRRRERKRKSVAARAQQDWEVRLTRRVLEVGAVGVDHDAGRGEIETDSTGATVASERTLSIGCRVVRGRDWRKGAQDGGPGGKGTVIAWRELAGKLFAQPGRDAREFDRLPAACALVEWDFSGRKQFYPIGRKNEYHLSLAVKSKQRQRENPLAKALTPAALATPSAQAMALRPATKGSVRI
eukprot:g808.t1